jgi:predicted secreted protein
MASTGSVNGTAIILKVGSTQIAKLKSNTLKVSRAAIDVSNKDSGGWKESIYGQGSGGFDFDGVFSEDGTWGFDEAYAAMVAKTVLTVLWTSATTGDKTYTASCILTSVTAAAPMEDAATFSGSLEFTGAPTQGTVS